MKRWGRRGLVGGVLAAAVLLAVAWVLTRPPAVDLTRLPDPDLGDVPGRVASLLSERRETVNRTGTRGSCSSPGQARASPR